MKVFFLDDEPLILKLIGLLSNGFPTFECTFFAKFEELGTALEQGNIPDIIVTDIKMPDINGMEVVTQLSEQYPTIKLAYCSSFGSLKQAFETEGRTFDETLVRPFYVKPIYKDIFSFIEDAVNAT